MRYLLDTNTVSDLVRTPQGRVAARIARVGEESVCTSIIVAAELRYGAARKGSARLLAQLLTVDHLQSGRLLVSGAKTIQSWYHYPRSSPESSCRMRTFAGTAQARWRIWLDK